MILNSENNPSPSSGTWDIRLVYCLLGAYVLFFTPFFILGFFNYPAVEDISETALTRQLGVWGHIKDLYLTFDGRFFVALLYAVNPLVYDQLWLYKLLPFFYFLLFVLGVWFLIDTIIGEAVKPLWKLTATLSFTVCVMYFIPNICFTFYYMMSSMVYMTPVVSSIFLVSFIIRIIRMPLSGAKFFYTAASCFLLIAIIGTNELFIAPVLLLLVLSIAFAIHQDRKYSAELIILFITALLTVFINASAPGIYLLFEEQSLEKDLAYSLSTLVKCINNSNVMIRECLTKHYFLWALTIFYLPVGYRLANDSKLVRNAVSFPLLPVLLLYLLIVHVVAFPYYWSLGNDDGYYDSRIFNITYFAFLFGWFLCLQLFISYLNRNNKLSFLADFRFPSWLQTSVLILLLPAGKTFREALHDLTSGEAYGYHLQMKETFEKCYHAEKYLNEKGVLELDTLEYSPATIYTGNRLNAAWAEGYEVYFSIKKVEVKE